MIQHTAVGTDERKRNILSLVKAMKYNDSATLAAFGIKVDDTKFLGAPARQLDPPKIQYSNGVVTPWRGQWNMRFDNKNMNFLKAAECLEWGVLNTDSKLDSSKLDSFVSEVSVCFSKD